MVSNFSTYMHIVFNTYMYIQFLYPFTAHLQGKAKIPVSINGLDICGTFWLWYFTNYLHINIRLIFTAKIVGFPVLKILKF